MREIVKEILSPNKKYKAEVIKRENGLFYIEVYKWDEEWETWLQVSREVSITDTEENAIKISTEILQSFSVDDTNFK